MPQPPVVDFEAHNAEVREVWAAYHAARPLRVPFTLGLNVRYTMRRPEANPSGIGWREYFADAPTMARRQCEHQHWIRHWLNHDHEMGLPAQWSLSVDWQNCYEALYLGCQLEFRGTEVPDTQPLLADEDAKYQLFDRGLPDPFAAPAAARAWALWGALGELADAGWEFAGRPVARPWPMGLGTDGPLTVACNLRGASEFCTDLLADPDYAQQLLTYITSATIERIQAYRARLDQPVRSAGWGLADDSVALLSAEQYRAHILPHHHRLVEALREPGGPLHVHLCGDAVRHFPTFITELGAVSFDTGYPIDHAAVRAQLGPEIELLGGPSVPFLATHGPAEVEAECARILTSGVTAGGRFVLREGNNLPAECPPENVWAMARAVRRWGRYDPA